jgi:TRAP-type mannitol/chloroaromatic compound transport system permease small subunit
LLSIAYGLQNDTHVRVDVFYLNFSPKTQALINIIGSVVFNAFNNKPIIQATWVATFLANFKGQISKIKAVISNQ